MKQSYFTVNTTNMCLAIELISFEHSRDYIMDIESLA